jgi:hypothetical protein
VTVAGLSLDQVLAAANKVQNHLPEGSTWDGKTDLPMDEGTFRQMMSEVEPSSPTGSGATGTTPPGGATPSGTGAASTSAPANNAPAAKPRASGPPAT